MWNRPFPTHHIYIPLKLQNMQIKSHLAVTYSSPDVIQTPPSAGLTFARICSICSPNFFFSLSVSIFESLLSTVNPSTAYSSPSRRSSWLGTLKAPLHIYSVGKIDCFCFWEERRGVRPIHFYWNLEDICLVWPLIRGEKYCQTARYFRIPGEKARIRFGCFHQNWVDRCSDGEDRSGQVQIFMSRNLNK